MLSSKSRVTLSLTLLAISRLAVSCESDITRTGVELTSDARPMAVLKTCHETAKVFDVQLRSLATGQPIVWEIHSASGSNLRRFTPGETPPEFMEVVPYAPPDTGRLQFRLMIDEANDFASFSLGQLAVGEVYVAGSLMTEEKFRERNVCN